MPDMLALRWGSAAQAGAEVQQDMASFLLSLGHPFAAGAPGFPTCVAVPTPARRGRLLVC